jgi:hypothetical protein
MAGHSSWIKTLDWPFGGDHWPEKWPEINLTKETFSSSLTHNQKEDLIQCFYEQEAKITKAHPNPPYRMRGQYCTLGQLRDYFGKESRLIKVAVRNSTEYKAYAARSRPPPPPEMSLVAPNLIDTAAAIISSPPPEMSLVAPNLIDTAAAGTKRGAPDPDPAGAGTPGALPGADARAPNFDVAGEALSGASPVPPPQSQGETLPPVIALTARRN